MQIIEGLTDAEIAEAHRSADIFAEVSEMTAPLHAFMSLLHAFDWLGIRKGPVKAAFLKWLDGVFGDQIAIAQGEPFDSKDAHLPHLMDALGLAASERFLNWQVAFPGVWSDWEATGVDRRLRRRDRKPALGPNEAPAGRVVRGTPTARSPWHPAPPTGSA